MQKLLALRGYILIILIMDVIIFMFISLFNDMLIHNISPESMILGTMVPIPKNKRQSLCNSDNYSAIACVVS